MMMSGFTSKDFDEYVDDMIGDYAAELKKKTFNDRRKTSYLEAIKYNADIIWNEYNIKRDDDPATHTVVNTDVLGVAGVGLLLILLVVLTILMILVLLGKSNTRSFEEKCICEKKAQASKNLQLFALKNSGDFCDIILMGSDQQEVPVHRLVMASMSPSFSAMMKTPDTIIIIPFSKKIILILVEFAYTGSSQLDESTIMETLEAANTFKIDELVQFSGDFLVSSVLNVSNAVTFYDLSRKFCCGHITDRISKFICQNFKSFIANDQALFFTAEQISTFFHSVDLQMKIEELEQFTKAWAEANVGTFTMDQMQVIKNSIPLKRIPSKAVLVFGGVPLIELEFHENTIETFNNLTNSWSINPIELPIEISHYEVVELEGKFYVAGGWDEKYSVCLDSVFCLDMSTKVWEEMSSMISKRCWFATVVLGGKIFALGGEDDLGNILNTVEMYDPSTNMWTEIPSMNHRRSDFAATVLEGKLFAVGGYDGQDALSSIEYFCPIQEMWIESSPLVTARSGTTAMALEDKIFVLGGYDGTEILKSVECFQLGISRAVWIQVPDMLHRRSNSSSFVFEGKLVMAGGYKKDDSFSADGEMCGDVEEYCSKGRRWGSSSNLNIKRSAHGYVVLFNTHGFKI